MIEISKEAAEKIKKAISDNYGKSPRIVLKSGGCAGNMLVLTLSVPEESDNFLDISGIKFAISKEANEHISDISISVKNNLGSEIIIKNNASKTCKCGKSFKI